VPEGESELEYVRKRGNNLAYSYSYTKRLKCEDASKRVEVKTNISA